MPLPSPIALALELALVSPGGEHQAAGERPTVPAGELADVEHRRGDVLLADTRPRHDGD